MSLHDLSDAIQRHLELQPPFLFLDPDGRPVVDNAALATCASLGKQVVVKLTEGVLHDVSRRVDQLRHLQWGFIADQLSALRREQDRHQAEVCSWKVALAHEQGVLEKNYDELRRRVEEVYAMLIREYDSGDDSLQTSASVASSTLLSQIHSAQATCQTEIRDLKQELNDCQLLLSDQKSQPVWQAVEEVLRAERQEQARLLDDLKTSILQKQNVLNGEFRALFATKSEAAQLANDVRMLRKTFLSQDVPPLDPTSDRSVSISSSSPPKVDCSKTAREAQGPTYGLADNEGTRSPQRLGRCLHRGSSDNSLGDDSESQA
jgi:hypothetical protein